MTTLLAWTGALAQARTSPPAIPAMSGQGRFMLGFLIGKMGEPASRSA